jgi:hypothetical protein
VYDDNVVIIAVTEIYEVSVNIDFVSDGQTIQSPAVKVGCVCGKRNGSLLAVNWTMAIVVACLQREKTN